MSFLAVLTPDWITALAAVVNAAVIVILVWLTARYVQATSAILAESQKSRVAAERSNDTAIRPILAVDYPRDVLVDQDSFTIKNVGFGPAFNVEVSPIANGSYRCEFVPIPLLERGSPPRILETVTLRDGVHHNIFSPRMQYFIAMLREGTESMADDLVLSISARCCDANGKRYEYTHQLVCRRPRMSVNLRYVGAQDD